MLAANSHLNALHRRHFPANGQYLALLGVQPAHQGQGHAKKLLESMLTRLDALGQAACLETENARNVGLYQKFGFQLLDQSPLTGSPVNCWVMMREPR
jgi:ribosomal protein S18 acetylase RimI-like enzyme